MAIIKPKVLLIGWDAADWKVMSPLLDAGLMPTLSRFVNDGVMGNLASLRPMLSPMLWNSIATGKRPEKHGIYGFTEPDPHTAGIRPVTSTSRKVKAIWNILTQQKLKTHVVGWFGSHPAEPINGICVSDLFALPTGWFGQPWPAPTGTIHPESLAEKFACLRMHPAEVKSEAILPFIPDAARIDQNRDRRLITFARILAENCSIHNCATWILQNEEWDFTAVFYNGIDHFCHAFMDFHPPRQDHVPEDLFELYRGVVTGAYRFHDMMLDRLLQLTPPDATVVLVSDHGFHSDHLRPRALPRKPAGPTVQHRQIGAIAMRGPAFLKDERIYGATLLDITPTILTLFGLPVGQDMDGRPLVQAFERKPEVEWIPTWEAIPGQCGMHPADMQMDAESAKAVIDQFVALGYIKQEDDNRIAVSWSVRELKYNRACALIDDRKPAEALPLLEELHAESPDEVRFCEQLAHCYFRAGRKLDAKNLLSGLIAEPEGGSGAPRSDNRATQSQARADWCMGVILSEERDYEAALHHLQRAEQANPSLPDLHIRIGSTYLSMGRTQDARMSFDRALDVDGDSPEAFLGKAICHLHLRENEEASECALTAVGLQHFLPRGHYVLGLALGRMGHLRRAVAALETALSFTPGMLNAHRLLKAIHALPGGDKSKWESHRDSVQKLSAERAEGRH